MPEEIFSEKNRMANNGTLCKTLFYNITRQTQVPAAITSVGALNCYNRIAHAMASLIFQAFGVLLTAVEMMLGNREYKVLPESGIWQFEDVHGWWNKHQNAGAHAR